MLLPQQKLESEGTAMKQPNDHELPLTAPVRNVVDVYFGQEIVDPYRWMEEPGSAELAEWLAAQNRYTRGFLERLPLRDELLARVTEVSNAGATIVLVQRRGDRLFYLKLAPGDNNWRLCVRDGFAGEERMLVDTEATSADGRHSSITDYQASHDGQLVTYLVSPSGSEYGEVRVLDVRTGRGLGDRIERTRWDAGAWLPDNRSFAYLRFRELPNDAPQTDRLKDIRVYLHALGTPVAADTLLFGSGVEFGAEFEETPIPFVYIPVGSRYALARVNSGVTPNFAFYVVPLEALGQAPVPWRRIVRLEDEVAEIAIHDDSLYLLTYKDAPRFKVVRTSLASPDPTSADVIVPESDLIGRWIWSARDALYVKLLDGGVTRLNRIDHVTLRSEPVRLPYDGAATVEVADQLHDGVLFNLSSWTRSPAVFAYEPVRQVVSDTGLLPPLPVDMSDIDAVTAKVPSHDGVMIPLVILVGKNTPRDGTRPTLLSGYGAYGAAYATPWFQPQLLPWLERGGIYAVAGVRGGGEYGEEWHLAGKEATKPNTWKDFIACAEYLVREGYTSPAHLAGEGTSAGGILISNAIAERPDLFGAAIINVGLTNALRLETTANGVPNIPEFGTHKTEEGFRALLEMDAYHKLRAGVDYPAVLLTHGISDPRVEPWFSAKMAAQLQRVGGNDQLTLLRIDYDAGHGVGSTKEQRNSRSADVYAFLFNQLRSAERG
jgi:prolyl oligopeptidase